MSIKAGDVVEYQTGRSTHPTALALVLDATSTGFHRAWTFPYEFLEGEDTFQIPEGYVEIADDTSIVLG